MASDKRCVCCKAVKRGLIRRGLCGACYNDAARAVRKGIISWDKLVKAGKASPSGRGPRSPMSKVIEELAGSRRS